MAEIPAGSKLVFIDADVPTKELKSSRSNSKTEVYTIEDIAETVGGGSDYTETIVNISSAQILDMGVTPIELLPEPGAGKYYDVNQVILEYKFVTTNYSSSYVQLSDASTGFAQIGRLIDFGAYDKVKIINIYGSAFENAGATYSEGQQLNRGLYLNTYSGANPTLGDGTLRVKIYHKTITFGE